MLHVLFECPQDLLILLLLDYFVFLNLLVDVFCLGGNFLDDCSRDHSSVLSKLSSGNFKHTISLLDVPQCELDVVEIFLQGKILETYHLPILAFLSVEIQCQVCLNNFLLI